VITSGVQSGTVDEQADLAPLADADPADVTGTITFDDVDLSDEPQASVTNSVVTTATLANGYVLTAGQEATLLGAFSLDDVLDGVSNSTFGDGSGEIAWTYDATNAAIDFLGENDQLVLTFTVTVDDQNGGTASQDVTITINGTNDAPVITSGVQSGTVDEQADLAPLADADP
ncbi:VCBS domain-containing protein, partial [Hoeflea alexandrii]|uniref:VCBS domain-containing protein n=2 Tax=Hoeflea alexandrii TaxID=288436 RepID=UPI0022AED2A1